jgi:hypothetical protein
MFDMKRVGLYFAVSIFRRHKSSSQFYNDEHDKLLVILKKPSWLRKSKYETKNQHHSRAIKWETSLSHDSKVKLKKTSMTQIYYTKRFLSVYATLIKETRVYYNEESILQEYNDNNHDTRLKDNVVVRFKAVN